MEGGYTIMHDLRLWNDAETPVAFWRMESPTGPSQKPLSRSDLEDNAYS